MRITIAAVGRLRAGPERELMARFLDRATATGRRLGIAFAVREIAESRSASAEARKAEEAEAILAIAGTQAMLVALDEGGKNLHSRDFARRLGDWRDADVADVVVAIGGADGHGAAVLTRASLRLAFGAMTWPHQLVRIMAAEQLYRAVTILSGHPYHRD
jgi:23S rRNA (pseudouridine1915-N3)-methyltransferase